MLELYTIQKLMEYDQADRKNHVKIRREQEKMMAYQLAKEKKSRDKSMKSLESYSAKPTGAKYTERNPGKGTRLALEQNAMEDTMKVKGPC